MSLHCSPSLLTNTTFQIRHLDISALFASGASCVMGSRPTERYVEKHVTTITKEAGIVIPGFFYLKNLCNGKPILLVSQVQ